MLFRIFNKFILVGLFLFVAGCSKYTEEYYQSDQVPHHDPGKKLSKKDYESMLSAQNRAFGSSYVAPKKRVPPPNPWPKKLVSLEITPTATLDEVFEEVTKGTQIGIQYKGLKDKKGYVYRVYKRPVEEVVNTLCDMATLRCVLEKGVLSIEPDTPYYVTYDLQFIASKRSDEGHIAISTDIFSLPFGRKGQSNYENGSSSRLKTEASVDFWEELDTTLQTILFEPNTVMSTQTFYPSATDALHEKELKVLPSQEEGVVKGKQTKQSNSKPESNYSKLHWGAVTKEHTTRPYALHKQAGLLTVFGTAKQQKLVYQFLERLKRKATAQVLIEAKVVEVTLNDQYKSGINWRSVFDGDVNFAAPLVGSMDVATGPPFSTNTTATKNFMTFGASGSKFSVLMQMIESFGTVRTISNPRITVVNNQPAVLKVAENKVYFQVKYDRKLVTDGNGNVTFSDIFASESQINTIPIGFVMAVLPAVDVDQDEVILTLRPSITRTTSSVADPAVSIVNSNVSSSIPIVEVREMDSVMRLTSGQIAVMGGLMQDRVQNTDTGVPGLSEIPLLGNLFKSKVDERQVTELVIFLQATILHDDNPVQAVTNADQKLYTKFIDDPRPLNFEEASTNVHDSKTEKSFPAPAAG